MVSEVEYNKNQDKFLGGALANVEIPKIPVPTLSTPIGDLPIPGQAAGALSTTDALKIGGIAVLGQLGIVKALDAMAKGIAGKSLNELGSSVGLDLNDMAVKQFQLGYTTPVWDPAAKSWRFVINDEELDKRLAQAGIEPPERKQIKDILTPERDANKRLILSQGQPFKDFEVTPGETEKEAAQRSAKETAAQRKAELKASQAELANIEERLNRPEGLPETKLNVQNARISLEQFMKEHGFPLSHRPNLTELSPEEFDKWKTLQGEVDRQNMINQTQMQEGISAGNQERDALLARQKTIEGQEPVKLFGLPTTKADLANLPPTGQPTKPIPPEFQNAPVTQISGAIRSTFEEEEKRKKMLEELKRLRRRGIQVD